MDGRFFRLGELPTQPLSDGGALAVPPPLNRPPVGNAQVATQQPGKFRELGDNQSVWQAITFVATADSVMLQSMTYRKFLLFQNKSGTGSILIGFGYEPNQSNALILPPGVGYEPYNYPINEIFIKSDGPNVEGLMLYGV